MAAFQRFLNLAPIVSAHKARAAFVALTTVAALSATALATLGMPSTARAQAAPRYTLKELVKPSSARHCAPRYGLFRHSLNNVGDVVMTCDYFGGLVFGAQSELGFFIPFLVREWLYQRPVVWPATGGTRVLNTPSRSNVGTLLLITDAGEVHGSLWPLDGSGRLLPQATKHYVWKGVTPSLYQPPAGLTGEWQVVDITPAGRLRIIGPQSSRLVVNGLAYPLPRLPDGIVPDNGVVNWVFNDQDQLVADVQLQQPPEFPHKGFLYEGQSVTSVGLDGGEVLLRVMDINNRGQVLGATQSMRGFVWAPGQPTQYLPALAGFDSADVRAINDSGVVVGGLRRHDSGVSEHRAVAWIDGKVIDLAAATTVPRNWVLESAVAVNERGQILVSGRDVTKTGTAGVRMAVLTPQ